jgi:hypothetical protein
VESLARIASHYRICGYAGHGFPTNHEAPPTEVVFYNFA